MRTVRPSDARRFSSILTQIGSLWGLKPVDWFIQQAGTWIAREDSGDPQLLAHAE